MQFNQLFHRLKAIAPSAPVVDSERRGAWRINRSVTLVGRRRGGDQVALTTVNLGPGGLRVAAAVALRTGEEIRLSPEGASADLPARVVWCQRMANGPGYEAGMLFQESGPEQPLTVESLLEACGVRIHSRREQRKAPRFNTAPMRGFLYTPDDQVNAVDVLDVAVGGVLVSSIRRLSVDSHVRLQLQLGDLGDFESPGKIVRVRSSETEGLSLLAISFVSTDVRSRDRLIGFLTRQLRAT